MLSATMQSVVCHSTLILQVLYLLESSGALSCKEQTSYQQIPVRIVNIMYMYCVPVVSTLSSNCWIERSIME